jgi:hypothetical protein
MDAPEGMYFYFKDLEEIRMHKEWLRLNPDGQFNARVLLEEGDKKPEGVEGWPAESDEPYYRSFLKNIKWPEAQ